jgi:hypothetical protein
VSRGGRHLSTLRPGVTLGEMAYLQPDKPLRSASHELQAHFDKAFIRLRVSRLVESNERA